MLSGCIMKSEIPTLLLPMSLTMYLTTDSAGVNLAFLPFLLRSLGLDSSQERTCFQDPLFSV